MAAPMTNTVHVELPEGYDLAAMHLIFQRFGEVVAVDFLPEEPAKLTVVYFDVRSAARAVEALGSAYCAPAPQTGERRVRLAGDAHFDSADIEGISNVLTASEEDGTYVLEFFDFRDAARYQAKVGQTISTTCAGIVADSVCEVACPPGLGKAQKSQRKAAKAAAALPQLPPGLSAPPGLLPEASKSTKSQLAAAPASSAAVAATAATPVCKVTISGLPNKLLSHPMMEAILQQAGFDDTVVTSFSTKNGKPCGEVTVHFLCEDAAHRCIAHFQGCHWDQSGNGVTATFIRLEAEQEKLAAHQARSTSVSTSKEEGKSAAAAAAAVAAGTADGGAAWQQAWWQPDIDALSFQQLLAANLAAAYSSEDALSSSVLSGEAPAWTLPSKKGTKGKPTLQAGAPAFIPGSLCVAAQAEASRHSRRLSKMPQGAGSDTSTMFGESEDEKESPKHLARSVAK